MDIIDVVLNVMLAAIIIAGILWAIVTMIYVTIFFVTGTVSPTDTFRLQQAPRPPGADKLYEGIYEGYVG